MAIPLLIIGTAFDGPSDIAVKPRSIEDAFECFGAACYERFTLDDGDKSVTLTYPTESNIDFYRWIDGLLTPFIDVSGVSVSGTVVSFEGLGYDLFEDAGSSTIELTLRYLRDMSEDDTSVYKAFAEASSAASGDIYVMRVGGTQATTTIGTAPNQLLLTSPYCGSLYNSTLAACDGETLTITPPPGKGDPLYYNLTGAAASDIAGAINFDYAKGYGCVKASASGSGVISIAAGYVTLCGGTDGELTDQVLADTLDQLESDGVKVIHICGRRFPSSAIEADTLAGVLSSDFLSDQRYPTMFVQGVTYDPALLPAAYAAAVIGSASIKDTSVTKVVGECYYSYSPVIPYFSSLAPAYAAILAKAGGGCVYEPVSVGEIRPFLDESTSRLLAGAGYVTFAQSISKGIVVFSDVASDPRWDATCHLTYLAIVSAVYIIVDPLIGTNHVDAGELEENIIAALDRIPTIAAKDVVVRVAVDNSISVEIAARPYGKVNTIKFGVSVNAAFTPTGSP